MGKIDSRYGTDWPSLRDQVSPEEWQARLDLAACYRLLDVYGMTDLIYNHVTLRIPGTEHLLINPNVPFDESMWQDIPYFGGEEDALRWVRLGRGDKDADPADPLSELP